MTGTNWRRENKRAKIPRESITSVGTHTRKTQHRSARSLTFPPFFGPILVPFSLHVAALFLSISAYSERVFFLRFLVSFSLFLHFLVSFSLFLRLGLSQIVILSLFHSIKRRGILNKE